MMILVSKEKFINWLIKEDYSEWTGSGYPSTVSQYVYYIERVMEEENIASYTELGEHVQELIKTYGPYGKKREFGNKGHATCINALKRFLEYLLNECDYKPDTTIYFV